MASRYTHDEYKAKLIEKNPHLDMISTYKNSRTKIRVKNTKCNHEWDVKPTSLLLGHDCPVCSGRVRKTHEQFVNEVLEINPNIKILGKYTNSLNKVECECLMCGRKWDVQASSLLQGVGCGNCYGNYLTNKEFIEKLNSIHPHIIPQEEYINGMTEIGFQCLFDKTYYVAKPKYVVRNEYACCPTCESKANSLRQTWTNQHYIDELQRVTKTIISVDEYIKYNSKIKHKCLKCSCEWYTSPASILKFPRCPKCDGSRGERKISDILDSFCITYELQKKFIGLKYKNPLAYDFYLPSYDLLIEYDGEFHYQPIFGIEKYKIEQSRDLLKNNFAKENNYRLLRIPYWDYDNIETILCTNLKKGGQ